VAHPPRPVLGELKTAKSRRSLRCPPVVVDALRRRQHLQSDERAAAGQEWADEWDGAQLVFTTATGRPIDRSNLRRYFRQACTRAGIGRWTPYEMRHSAASLMSAAGVPLEHVADVLGHDSTRMAAVVYRHVLAPTVEAGAAPMQALLSGDAGEPTGGIGSPDLAPRAGLATPTAPQVRADALVTLVETMGFEPTTPCLQSRCSSQLSYVPG
jgi:Phage integrase family